MTEDVTSEQHEVQRKMGRCLLRLQQYEKLLKALAAHQSIEGPGDQLMTIRDQKAEGLKNKTLGHLVGVLTGSYLSVQGAESGDAGPDEPRDDVPRSGWIRSHSTIAMSPESYAETVQQLSELVALRNNLVHHFIETYDVWTLQGCRDAVAYLDDAYLKVDSHYATLAAWAKSMQDAHAVTASFFASKAWEDYFVHGIAPEGTVDWPRATVVELLREATTAHAQAGWTNLADAIRRIGALHPEQTPKRYGCTSWRQVLHESKHFEVRRDKAMDESPGQTWYRRRDDAGKSS
ncbi:MAG TPA: OST-HTH/LOTUS domain-containing protein [Ideonella sp.]|uniref:OST-HTH/LOTUS domain-containing protein n=1 Tax=Ideonella sp. TaxID=1929293 RepID=UPI002BF9E3AC|nr:OST-HTH/LOTUS domain-containing protein [Ideonella sp.]HSI49159.1 OST-HTH/LOTUS domain-containing protein [Ideonella sp.]